MADKISKQLESELSKGQPNGTPNLYYKQQGEVWDKYIKDQRASEKYIREINISSTKPKDENPLRFIARELRGPKLLSASQLQKIGDEKTRIFVDNKYDDKYIKDARNSELWILQAQKQGNIDQGYGELGSRASDVISSLLSRQKETDILFRFRFDAKRKLVGILGRIIPNQFTQRSSLFRETVDKLGDEDLGVLTIPKLERQLKKMLDAGVQTETGILSAKNVNSASQSVIMFQNISEDLVLGNKIKDEDISDNFDSESRSVKDIKTELDLIIKEYESARSNNPNDQSVRSKALKDSKVLQSEINDYIGIVSRDLAVMTREKNVIENRIAFNREFPKIVESLSKQLINVNEKVKEGNYNTVQLGILENRIDVLVNSLQSELGNVDYEDDKENKEEILEDEIRALETQYEVVKQQFLNSLPGTKEEEEFIDQMEKIDDILEEKKKQISKIRAVINEEDSNVEQLIDEGEAAEEKTSAALLDDLAPSDIGNDGETSDIGNKSQEERKGRHSNTSSLSLAIQHRLPSLPIEEEKPESDNVPLADVPQSSNVIPEQIPELEEIPKSEGMKKGTLQSLINKNKVTKKAKKFQALVFNQQMKDCGNDNPRLDTIKSTSIKKLLGI